MVLKSLVEIGPRRRSILYETSKSTGYKYLIRYLRYFLYREVQQAMKQKDKERLANLIGMQEIIDILPRLGDTIVGINSK